MRILFTIGLTIFLSNTVFGTEQEPDKIIYKGKEYDLHTNPLETYFEKYPDKRPKSKMGSSALYRGYVATFEIIDNQLYLKDIKVMNGDTWDEEGYSVIVWKSVLNKVFPKQKLIKIDWMTGLLVLPYGERVKTTNLDFSYGSTFEHYILLEIDKGDLKTEKLLDYEKYEKFKEKQFQTFKKTEEYEKIKAKLKKAVDWDDEFIDSFLRNEIIEYTSKILVEDDEE